MKKALAILLVILLLGMIFTGCSKKQPAVKEQPPANEEEQKVENEEQKEEEADASEEEKTAEEEVDESTVVDFEVLDIEDLDDEMKAKVEEASKEAGLTVLDEENSIILVSLGERPTGGYSVEVGLEKQQDEILVRAIENKPGEDDVVTQVITYPYVIIKVNGDVSNIRLVQPEEEVLEDETAEEEAETKDVSEEEGKEEVEESNKAGNNKAVEFRTLPAKE